MITQSITYILYIFKKTINLLLNEFVLENFSLNGIPFTGVSIGYLFISSFIFGILLKSLLNVPLSHSYNFDRIATVRENNYIRLQNDMDAIIYDNVKSSRVHNHSIEHRKYGNTYFRSK